MTVKYFKTHFFRVLPNGEVQRWIGVSETAADDRNALPVCNNGCHGGSTWVRETNPDLLGHLAQHSSLPIDAPCRCLLMESTRINDESEVLGEVQVVEVHDHGHKPIAVKFSWTVGLEWDCGLSSRVDDNGIVEIFDREGKLRFRSRVPARELEAELLRDARHLLF